MTTRLARWVYWSGLALLSWGVWAIMAKLIGSSLTGAQNQALSTLGMVPILIALPLSNRFSSSTGKRLRGILFAVLAGTVSSLGNVVYYHALGHGHRAAIFAPLAALYPLTTIFLAILVLKERLNRIQLTGVLTSLLAIYLFNVDHDKALFSTSLIYALPPILLWGLSAFLQKLATNHVTAASSSFWFLAACLPFAIVLFIWEPLATPIAPHTWLLVIAEGLFLALGTLAVLLALAAHGKASVIIPLSGLYPLVSMPIAMLCLGESVSGREAAAALLAMSSVAMLLRQSRFAPRPDTGTARAQPRYRFGAGNGKVCPE